MGDRGGNLLDLTDPPEGMEQRHLLAGALGDLRVLLVEQCLVALGVDRANATAFARIPAGPWSTATVRVKPSTAAFAVA